MNLGKKGTPLDKTTLPVWARDILHNAGAISGKGELQMNIAILTEDQEKILNDKRHEYTEQDILDLSILSSSISSLIHVMSVFYMYEDGRESDQGHELPILGILEMLIKPIDRFLNAGAPITQKNIDKEEETKETEHGKRK
jgi:hypothetical protein